MKERDEVEILRRRPKTFKALLLSLFSCDCVHSRLYQRDIVQTYFLVIVHSHLNVSRVIRIPLSYLTVYISNCDMTYEFGK